MVIDSNFNIRQFILEYRICTSRITESGDSMVIDFNFNIRHFLLVRRICTSRDIDRYRTLNFFVPNFEHYSTRYIPTYKIY